MARLRAPEVRPWWLQGPALVALDKAQFGRGFYVLSSEVARFTRLFGRKSVQGLRDRILVLSLEFSSSTWAVVKIRIPPSEGLTVQ